MFKTMTVCLVLLGGAVWAAPAAEAATTSVVCIGTADATYSPGITRDVQVGDVDVEFQLNCTQTLPLPITQLTGTATTQVTLPYSCENLFGSPPGTSDLDIDWSTGESSNFEYTTSVQRINATTVVTLLGLINDGRYDGSNAQLQVVYPNLSLTECDQPGGVTELEGVVAFGINKL